MRALYAAAGALALAAVIFAAGWQGRGYKEDSDELKIQRAAIAGANAAGDKVIGAIGKLRPRYLTITNEVTRASDQAPQYRDPACYQSDAVWLQLSAAYQELGLPPLDRASLPPAAPTSGPQPVTDDTRPH